MIKKPHFSIKSLMHMTRHNRATQRDHDLAADLLLRERELRLARWALLWLWRTYNERDGCPLPVPAFVSAAFLDAAKAGDAIRALDAKEPKP